jgi:hypothetical protein
MKKKSSDKRKTLATGRNFSNKGKTLTAEKKNQRQMKNSNNWKKNSATNEKL